MSLTFYNLRCNTWYQYVGKHTVSHYLKFFAETEDQGQIDYIVVSSGKVEKGRSSLYAINTIIRDYKEVSDQKNLNILYDKKS